MQYNYKKLKSRIIEKYETQSDFASSLGMSKSTLSCKMNGHRDWTQREIEDACNLLDIGLEGVGTYFFAH